MPAFEPHVVTTQRSVVVTDDLLNSPVRLYYDPATFRWRAYLLTPSGAFYREVNSISVCACAVAEYCKRSYSGGNIYLDVCYCEEIEVAAISRMFQPHHSVLAAYHANRMRIYRRWQRAVVAYVADYIKEKAKELWESARDALDYVFLPLEGIEPDYYGFFLTVYRFCPGFYYGLFCRQAPRTCTPVDCRDICDTSYVDCDYDKLEECRVRKKVVL